MKNILPLLTLILLLCFVPGCEKDKPETPVSVGKPTITPTFVIGTTDNKSVTVPVTVSWTTQNVSKGTLDGLSINIPNGDTTFSMKKGETKNFTFVVENSNGKKVQEYLKVSVPMDPSVPTISTSFTFNDQVIDTLPYFGGPGVKIKVVFANGDLYLNGIRYENSPATFDFTVTETKTFDFVVIGPGGETPGSITIPVKVPGVYESLLTGGNSRKWEIYKYERSYEIDANYVPDGGSMGITCNFYLVPQKMYDQDEGLWDWSIINSNTISGFGDREIFSYSETEMVWRYRTTEVGSNRYVWVKEYLRIIETN